MVRKFKEWVARSSDRVTDLETLRSTVYSNRTFISLEQHVTAITVIYPVLDAVVKAIRANKRFALYADYDVDGTMSCVSWIWFFQSIGYETTRTTFQIASRRIWRQFKRY